MQIIQIILEWLFEWLLNPPVVSLVVHTLIKIFVTLAGSSLIAFILFFGLRQLRHHNQFLPLLSIFWVMPSFIIVAAVIIFLRSVGAENNLYDWPAVYLGWGMGTVPVLVWYLLKGYADLDLRKIKAAQTLGASPWQVYSRIIFPQVSSFYLYGLAQSFYILLTSFSLVVILGGGSPRDTLETRIYQEWALNTQTGISNGSNELWVLVFWQCLVLVAVQMGLVWVSRKWNVSSRLGSVKLGEWIPQPQENEQTHSNSVGSFFKQKVISFTLLAFILFILIWFNLFRPVITSMVVASASATITLLLILWLGSLRQRNWRILTFAGSWVSPIVVSWLLWEVAFRFEWYDGSVFKVIAVQSFLFAPWVARSLFPLLDRRRKGEWGAAISMGASKWNAWRVVEWPRLRGTVFSLFGLLVAMSFSEVSSVIFFAEPGFEPLSLWIQNQYTQFRLDEAYGGTALLFLGIVLVVKWSHSHES